MGMPSRVFARQGGRERVTFRSQMEARKREWRLDEDFRVTDGNSSSTGAAAATADSKEGDSRGKEAVDLREKPSIFINKGVG